MAVKPREVNPGIEFSTAGAKRKGKARIMQTLEEEQLRTRPTAVGHKKTSKSQVWAIVSVVWVGHGKGDVHGGGEKS